jgi:hydrogenase maturation protease
MADDGAGLAALDRLRERWILPATVRAVEGDTWGMNLLPQIEGTNQLVLLDAMDTGAAPGTVRLLTGDAIPRGLATKLSPHQIDLREVLAVADLRGRLPAYLVAVGVQPERVEMSCRLSDTVSAALDSMADAAARSLRRLGHDFRRRSALAACMS